MPEPVHEIRVGDERRSEGDRVGGTGGDGGLSAVAVVAAIENERPVESGADQRCNRCKIGRQWMTGTGFGFDDVQIGETKAVQHPCRSREGDLGRRIGDTVDRIGWRQSHADPIGPDCPADGVDDLDQEPGLVLGRAPIWATWLR